MKKHLSIILCLIMVLIVFASCNNGNPSTETTTESGVSGETTTDPSSSDETTDPSGDKVYNYMDILQKDYSQYIEYGQYKGIEIDSTSEEFIALRLQRIQESLLQGGFVTEYEDRAIVDGDTVNIDFVGYFGDEAFENGSAEGQDLVIGSHSFIDTFEEQLIGHKPGEEVTVVVTFPDPYENNPDFAGKEATFKVKINMISSAPIYPDIEKDSKILKDCFGVDSVSELYESMKEDIAKELAYEKAMSSIVVKDYPQDELSELKAELMENVESAASQYGITAEEYLAAIGVDLDEEAEHQLSDRMFYYEVLRQEGGADYTEEEYNEMFEDFVKESQYESLDDLLDTVNEYYGSKERALYSLAEYLLPQKAISIIVDSVVVK